MEIFNIHLGEADAKEFCKQSEQFKINWIKNNTKQQDETLIKEFLAGPMKKSGHCNCGCGKKDAKQIDVVAEKVIADKKPTKKNID